MSSNPSGNFPWGGPNSDDGGSSIFQQIFISIIALSALLVALCLVRWFLLRTTARHISSLENRKRGGLDSAAIAALPTFPYKKCGENKDDDEENINGSSIMECSICLSAVEEGETVKLLPECLHSFHGDCVDLWISGHTTCPVCRIVVLGSMSAVHQPSQVEMVAVPVVDLQGRP